MALKCTFMKIVYGIQFVKKHQFVFFSLRDDTFLKIVFEAIIWFDKVFVVRDALRDALSALSSLGGCALLFNLRSQRNTATLALRATQCKQATSLCLLTENIFLKCSTKYRTVLLYVPIESYHCLWIGWKPSCTHRQSEY